MTVDISKAAPEAHLWMRQRVSGPADSDGLLRCTQSLVGWVRSKYPGEDVSGTLAQIKRRIESTGNGRMQPDKSWLITSTWQQPVDWSTFASATHASLAERIVNTVQIIGPVTASEVTALLNESSVDYVRQILKRLVAERQLVRRTATQEEIARNGAVGGRVPHVYHVPVQEAEVVASSPSTKTVDPNRRSKSKMTLDTGGLRVLIATAFMLARPGGGKRRLHVEELNSYITKAAKLYVKHNVKIPQLKGVPKNSPHLIRPATWQGAIGCMVSETHEVTVSAARIKNRTYRWVGDIDLPAFDPYRELNAKLESGLTFAPKDDASPKADTSPTPAAAAVPVAAPVSEPLASDLTRLSDEAIKILAEAVRRGLV